MFSLQSHNQVLYHLTQFASTVTTKSAPLPVKTKTESNHANEKKGDTNDRNSSQANTYSNVFVDNIDIKKLEAPFYIKSNNSQIILDQLYIKANKKQLQKHKGNLCYILKSTITESQKSYPCAPLTEPIVAPVIRLSIKQQHRTLCTFNIRNPLHGDNQIRTFKTERGSPLGKRNATNTSWLKKFFDEHLFFGKNLQKTIEMDIDKVKTLLTDVPETADDKKKLRAAFLEGFELGLGRRKRTRSIGLVYLGILGVVVTLYLAYQIGPGSAGSWDTFSFTHTRDYRSEVVEVKFDDCKGVDTAKDELSEIVAYLKNPEKYVALGGKLPKGVLLVGPPGTGKTLLARAVAGEAGVPFFYASGSEFDDIFVGQGARRIKGLFKAAREKAPSVIFIDEIDSVGRKRTNSAVQPYANQTINQLLAEMDGFLRNEGVIVLGATNKRKMLDNALMRPGRFDVEIYIDKPNFVGRKDIISYYLSKVLSREVDVDILARKTIGFTGSDIENMINQAALRAASNNADYVTMEHLDYAKDKVTMGPERKLTRDEHSTRKSAYHEAGHALVAYYTKDALPIHKITIVPRGPNLGHVQYLPQKEDDPQTKAELIANMDTALGGRVAEELTFGPNNITTGASSDLQKATQIAETMVKHLGMSEKVGLRVEYSEKPPPMAASTSELIDSEIKRLLNESSERVRQILTVHGKELVLLAETLLKYETLTGDELDTLLTNKTVKGEELKSLVTDRSNRPEATKIIPPLVDPKKHVL